MKRLALLATCLAPLAAAPAAAQRPADLVEVSARVETAEPGRGTLRVQVRIAEGWHVNSHRPSEDYLIPTALTSSPIPGVRWDDPVYPPGVMRKFSFSKSPLSVYEGQFVIAVPVRWGSASPPVLAGQLEYQACNDTQCLPPATAAFRTGESAGGAAGVTGGLPGGAVPLSAAPAVSGQAVAESEFGRNLADRGYLLVLLSLFVGGLALNLTPCVYPVIPLTVGFFGRQAAGSRGRILTLASLYVLGIVVMYSALGVAASLSGQLFGAALQNRWVLTGIAAILVALALSMFGLYELKTPTVLMRLAGGGSRTGAAGAFGMGLLVGIVAAPCVAPFTLGLLAFVAERRNLLLGVLFFGVLSLGLGLPYLFLALFSGSLSRLPRAGEWMEGVKKVFGWLLLAMAAYFLRLVLPRPWSEWLLPATLVLGAIVLLIRGFGLARLARFATAVLFLAGAAFFYPRKALGWQPYTETGLAESGRPAVLDFTADWCVPCLELDQRTFSDERVQKELSQRALFKVDLTRGGTAEALALTNKFRVLGVPTIVFLDGAGQERTDLRLVGFEDADKFLERLARAP
ncbi:MAG: protein-disulfide reductase DsbD family protein [Thermoanaerobaculia bacterium]